MNKEPVRPCTKLKDTTVIRIHWDTSTSHSREVAVFLLNEKNTATHPSHFIFHKNPESPCRGIRLETCEKEAVIQVFPEMISKDVTQFILSVHFEPGTVSVRKTGTTSLSTEVCHDGKRLSMPLLKEEPDSASLVWGVGWRQGNGWEMCFKQVETAADMEGLCRLYGVM